MSTMVGDVNLTSAEKTMSENFAEKTKTPVLSRFASTATLLNESIPISKPRVPLTLNVVTHLAPTAQVNAAFAVTFCMVIPDTGFHTTADDMFISKLVPVALRVKEPLTSPRTSGSPPPTSNDELVAPIDSVTA